MTDLKAHSFEAGLGAGHKDDLLGSFDSEQELQAYLIRQDKQHELQNMDDERVCFDDDLDYPEGSPIRPGGALGDHFDQELSDMIDQKFMVRRRSPTGDLEVKVEGDEVKNYVKEKSKYGLNVDIMWWDVMRLPLRTNSVDVFVTDLVYTLIYFFHFSHEIILCLL